MVADLAAALENESGVTDEKVASLQSAAAGAAHTAALHRLPELVAQVLQKIFDERLHGQPYRFRRRCNSASESRWPCKTASTTTASSVMK